MQKIQQIAGAVPGVEHVVTVSGISILDNRASLANAGVAFVVLKDWDVRLKEQGQDVRSISQRLNGGLQGVPEAFSFALPPPPIQGVGNVGGFTMQVELRNGNFDYALLQSLDQRRRGERQRPIRRCRGSPRPSGRARRNSSSRSTGSRPKGSGSRSARCSPPFQAMSERATSPNSTSSATSSRSTPRREQNYRATADDIRNLKVKAGDGTMTQIGTVVEVTEDQGPPLISLYNLYPSSTVVGSAAPGFSSGQSLDIMDQIGKATLRNGAGFDWTAMSFQEKQVGNQIYYVFGFALLLVYLVLAGQYESWILPLAVILGVPLALLGTVAALTYLGATNIAAGQAGVAATNLYTQIGLILLIALGSKNAILIVEYARQRRAEGMDIVQAAVEGARLRFRPIIMTSFAFILGVLPLVLATGAGRLGADVDRHRGLLRDDRLDLPGGGVRALVLCGDAAPGRAAGGQESPGAQGEGRRGAGGVGRLEPVRPPLAPLPLLVLQAWPRYQGVRLRFVTCSRPRRALCRSFAVIA